MAIYLSSNYLSPCTLHGLLVASDLVRCMSNLAARISITTCVAVALRELYVLVEDGAHLRSILLGFSAPFMSIYLKGGWFVPR